MQLYRELTEALVKQRKFLLLITAVPTVIAAMISLLLPKEYLSQTSILPANSRFSDMARFKANELKELYSAFGSGDDLDRIYATARSWPVMMKMVDSFRLVEHYRLTGKKARAREAALKEIRENCSIVKTEYGELHIKVWDKDSVQAASIANAMVAETEKVHQDLYRTYYAESLRKLEQSYQARLRESVSALNGDTGFLSQAADAAELVNYRRSIADLTMTLLNPPPALMVLERAIPSLKPDRPRVLFNVLAALLVSLFTGLAAVWLLPALKTSAA